MSWSGVKALNGCEWPRLRILSISFGDSGSESIRTLLNLQAAKIAIVSVRTGKIM